MIDISRLAQKLLDLNERLEDEGHDNLSNEVYDCYILAQKILVRELKK